MRNKQHRLGNRLLAILLGCGSLAFAALLVAIVFSFTGYIDNENIENAYSSVLALKSKVEAIEESSLRFARAAASDRGLISALNDGSLSQVKACASAAAANAGAHFVIITDESGAVLTSSLETASLDGEKAQAALAAALSGREYTAVDEDIASRVTAFSAVPVTSANATRGAVLVGFALDGSAIVDGIKEIHGDDVTIFYGDTRVSTTIRKDGQRVIGTVADGAVADRVLNKNESFSIELMIANSDYVAYYIPLIDKSGETVGILFAGTPKAEADAVVKQMIALFVILAVATLAILAFLLAYFTQRTLSRPLAQLVATAKEIADGNLDVEINANARNEIGELSDAFRQMAGNLNEMIGNIGTAADQITEGSRQVSLSSAALASGAAEQASAVEEFSASLEQISAQTTQNADRASQANELSGEVLAKAEGGNAQMQAMLAAMSEINRASESIAKIIKVIDDIAFQTNILALNAAVEAAREGEHGKGFADVAEEVRNLAAKSAAAAKETSGLIEDSSKSVSSGSKLARETAEALERIVSEVSRVAALVNGISVSSGEQSSGIEQINQGLMQISRVVQSISATSQQSAAATKQLTAQADALRQQVAGFTLKRLDAPAADGAPEAPDRPMNSSKNRFFKTEANAAGPRPARISLGKGDVPKAPVRPTKISLGEEDDPSTPPAKRSQVALSDSEFGKY